MNTMRAVRVSATGGPEMLEVAEVPVPTPGATQARVRLEASGINFIDTYFRRGLYPMALPAILGQEGAGIVEAVGDAVTTCAVGDRVVFAVGAAAAYAQQVVIDQAHLVRVPEGVPSDLACASMLQGMTAHYLVHGAFMLGPAHTALVHAAAGGTGQLLVQLAKRTGARVIGTVSSAAKAAIASSVGCDHVVRYDQDDFVAAARAFTDGRGVEVVYDGVGAKTFDGSLRALARRGTCVLFGQASGPVGPFDPQLLNQRGSLFLTRPKLQDYIATRAELEARASDVLGAVRDGALRVEIGGRWPLAQAADAHRALESGGTTGKLLLMP
ncbi:MAG: quinone oxidoreductase [Gemmatimonadaceae bacterium]|jgi:NADPH2:quinone reductase|nr:quinone oxidoreductase [Gemmatimonadaceae bacterium]